MSLEKRIKERSLKILKEMIDKIENEEWILSDCDIESHSSESLSIGKFPEDVSSISLTASVYNVDWDVLEGE